MKLYDLRRGDAFYLNPNQERGENSCIFPPSATEKMYILHHIDGMYSYVTDTDENVYHFAAWTEVNPVNNT